MLVCRLCLILACILLLDKFHGGYLNLNLIGTGLIFICVCVYVYVLADSHPGSFGFSVSLSDVRSRSMALE